MNENTEQLTMWRKGAANIIEIMSPQWQKVLPSVCTPERFARVALSCLSKNPTLLEALQTQQGKADILSSFMTCAEMGIEPDGRRAHLIPYKNKKNNTFNISLIFDYKGLVELAMRSGKIANIHADKVYKQDTFVYNKGRLETHIPNWDVDTENEKPYLYYCNVQFKDGSEVCEVMRVSEIEGIKKRSNAWRAYEKYGVTCPWVTDYDEMAKKGLACDTPIFTANGWKTMGKIAVGDIVYDMNGQPTPVIAVSEIKHLPCYKVTFSNGDVIVCDNEHLWISKYGTNACREEWKTIGIQQLHEIKQSGKGIVVPVTKPVCTIGAVESNTSPYLLGYWLGNGSSSSACVTCHQDDVAELSRKIEMSIYTLGKIRFDSRSKAATIGIKHGFKDYLRSTEQLGNKHFPKESLKWSINDRIELVRGLMDSDGCTASLKRPRVVFSNTNEDLADGMYLLLQSLGECANLTKRKCKGYGKVVDCYIVQWQPGVFVPVSLARKVANVKKRKLSLYRSIKSIEPIDSIPTKCIAVESETHSYLAGFGFVPTHNTTFRRVSKWLPLSPEVLDAFDKDDEADKAIVIDAEQTSSRKSRFAKKAEEVPALEEQMANQPQKPTAIDVPTDVGEQNAILNAVSDEQRGGTAFVAAPGDGGELFQ